MADGRTVALTRSFYPATDNIKTKFEKEFKYTLEYGPLSSGGFCFVVYIIGLIIWSIDMLGCWH